MRIACLALAVLTVLAAAPLPAEIGDTAIWEGYEMVRVGADLIIRPTKPNPQGEYPLLSQKILKRLINEYAQEAQQAAHKPLPPPKAITAHTIRARKFLKELAYYEVKSSAAFQGKPNPFRNHREAIEGLLRAQAEVVVDPNPAAKGEYHAVVVGGVPGEKARKKFDEYMTNLVTSLHDLDAEIERREAEGGEGRTEEAPAKPISVPAAPPAATADAPAAGGGAHGDAHPGWAWVSGRETYQPPAANPAGPAPLRCLKSLRLKIVEYAQNDKSWKARLEASLANIRNKALVADTREMWRFAHAVDFLKGIGYDEALESLDFGPTAPSPFRPLRQKLEGLLGQKVVVVMDASQSPKVGNVPGGPRAADFWGEFEQYMAELAGTVSGMDAEIATRDAKGEDKEE